MINKITVTNHVGESFELELRNPYKTGLLVQSIDGMGPAKANINSMEIATYDGAIFNSSRITSRNIVLNLAFVDDIYGHSIEYIRQSTYKYFPVKSQIELIFETDNRKAAIYGYVESNEPDVFQAQETTQISIVCPDPFFYSQDDEASETVVFSGITPYFEFPFSNESLTTNLLNFGEITTLTENVVTYKGDYDVGITVTIHAIGAVEDLVIRNTTTSQTMTIDTDALEELTGYGIIAMDDIVIVTNKGNKSITLIRDGVSTNILNCLDLNSDWFTLTKGDNIFTYTATSGAQNLQFKISFDTAYEGV